MVGFSFDCKLMAPLIAVILQRLVVNFMTQKLFIFNRTELLNNK